ncbi:putative permease, DMT superfamily [Desulfitobacterium dichloroeliminans LMG P-21439]|uniref:Putative permease, DMT superfamily n=1 Tax=Desulfitobacterium dichloroeliminans (strain LMG P-21439 / DCA1) TaxID=871963 RepID=L0F820_DESDL|nr:DMT family transporter [Desulfitobacterium dichloroeliminans]AGA69175.1 putative permease, DMT superfamily [Desulfitobacterium dichloroeliminans LMG P-21439]
MSEIGVDKNREKTQDITRKAIRGVLFTLIGGISWGFSGACGQYLFSVKGINPHWVTAVRMFTAGLIIFCFVLFKYKEKMVGLFSNKKDRWTLIGFSIFGLIFCQYTYLLAISYTNAGTATVLQYLGPLLIMVFVCGIDRRLPTKIEGIAIVLAVTGTFLLTTHGSLSNLVISSQGLFWGLMSALGLMLYTIIPGRIISRWGSIVVTSCGMLMGGLILLVLVRPWRIPVSLDWQVFLGMLAIIVIGTVVSFTLYLQGVSDIGPVKASMIACVEPVAATLFSAFWLNTPFVGADILGFAFIITTVILLTSKGS